MSTGQRRCAVPGARARGRLRRVTAWRRDGSTGCWRSVSPRRRVTGRCCTPSSTRSAPSCTCRQSSRPRCARRPSEARRQPAPARAGRDRAVAFFTVDPAGSMDLDQAMYLERTVSGYRVRYAIADVPSWRSSAGRSRSTRETRRRGQTIYAPDRSTPLHPRDAQRGRREPAAGAGAPRVRLGPAPGRRRARVAADGLPRDGPQRRADGLRGRADGGRRRHAPTSGCCC